MTEEAEKVAGVREGSTLALPFLSPVAAEFLQRHPEEARVAVTAALEAVAARFDLAGGGVPAALHPFLVEAPQSTDITPLIGVDEAAKRLSVSRATVYNWIDSRRLLGWRLTRQGTLIPAEQILGPGEVVTGIDRVLEVIPVPRSAWRFLSEESAYFDTPRRPIDALKEGQIDAVVAAAVETGEAFT